MSEEETLLGLAGYLYHYDVGTIHDESFSDKEWADVFDSMIKYVEKRIGTISFNEKMRDWFKSAPIKK